MFSSALSGGCKAEGSAGTKFDNGLIWIHAQRAVDGAVCSPGRRTGRSSLHPHQPGIYPKQRIINSLRACLSQYSKIDLAFQLVFICHVSKGLKVEPPLQRGV